MPGAMNKMASKALSGSAKFELGNSSMEYDAALDAMTIDADHENELGMEGMDMYANKLAALSGMGDRLSVDVDGDGVQDGIDIDGDGTVDIDASKPGQMMKYSEFKAPGLLVKTGKSIFQDPFCELTDYQKESNGIVPGYAGHIPRARDKYGGAAIGGCSPTPTFEVEIKSGQWKLMTNAAINEAMHLALQGGGPQHYSSSDNKQETTWDYEVRWNGSALTQTNVKTKKERQVRQKASSWMGSLLDAFDEVFLVPDSAASRLIPLERPRKPPPPTDADSAKLHVAHAAVWDAGCSVYGGFVRDWVIRGESANDIDVNTGDYDATQRAMQQALQPYGITMQTSQPWGETKAYRRLTFVWQGSSLEVDLVDPSKVPHTPPGVDCDVGNLKIDSRGGLQLKVPELVSLEKSIKHALSKKFVCFYEPSSDMAKRRIHKYMQRGWASKNEKPKYAARYWEPKPLSTLRTAPAAVGSPAVQSLP